MSDRQRIMDARHLLGEAEQELDKEPSNAHYLVGIAMHVLAPLHVHQAVA